MTISPLVRQSRLIVGVDAHKDFHHAVILTSEGRRVADRAFPVSSKGYAQLLSWARAHGQIQAFGIESTGSYAAGLTRFITARHVQVKEVNTPHAHTKARKGKNDAIDAKEAGRKILARQATAIPKHTGGAIESIRMLMLARESAVKARTNTLVQLP